MTQEAALTCNQEALFMYRVAIRIRPGEKVS